MSYATIHRAPPKPSANPQKAARQGAPIAKPLHGMPKVHAQTARNERVAAQVRQK